MMKVWALLLVLALHFKVHALASSEERRAETAASAVDVKPGAAFTLAFPDLPPDRRGQPAQCEVSIPKAYDPARKVPLVVWLGGADGGNTADRSFLPEGDFVVAGLPYPQGADHPAQTNMVGQYEKVWAYQRRMIEEIARQVPNLDPATSIIAGFSNGGHAIDGMLRLAATNGLADHFGAFILVEGGGTSAAGRGDYPPLQGKFAYVCWGEKSANRESLLRVGKRLEARGARVTLREMQGAGHGFPESEKANVRAWLKDEVRRGVANTPAAK
jgi:dienelactone hydrolase